MYFLKSQIQGTTNLSSLNTVYSVDYELMHKRFGHPSKQVLENAKEHTKNFPWNIPIPQKTPICHGWAEGKMPSKSFPLSTTHATKTFQKIHSDLKSLLVESYHWFKYFVTFLDNYSSHLSIALLRNKDDTLPALK